jgi:hypothetical protein
VTSLSKNDAPRRTDIKNTIIRKFGKGKNANLIKLLDLRHKRENIKKNDSNHRMVYGGFLVGLVVHERCI